MLEIEPFGTLDDEYSEAGPVGTSGVVKSVSQGVVSGAGPVGLDLVLEADPVGTPGVVSIGGVGLDLV